MASVPHNLPTQSTPLVGRATEIAAVAGLLENPDARLVTILGPGGMGKTRLSVAVAEDQLAGGSFADGTFFVPLAGVEDSERIVSVIAEAMDLRLEQGEAQLLNYLQARRTLLVLDNFEQLLEGTDLVLRLLEAAPNLRILVTSRERLRLQIEQVYPIQGLSIDEKSTTDDARQLFLQAAGRIRPDFRPAGDDLLQLNRICRLVEGMPLALELAAVWVDMLTLSDIVAEIERNLEFLETDMRDVPDRHRSMRAVFDASWRNLSSEHQQLLAQVSVFRGGFTREAAAAVANASLRPLATLVNKSLLTFDPAADRYHIHELLRQFVAAQAEEDDQVSKRHAAYYCNWMAAQVDRLTGPEQMTVVRKIQSDMSNVRMALFKTLQDGQFADLDVVLPTLVEYYFACGQFPEGIDLFGSIHATVSRQPDQAPFTLFWTSLWLNTFHGLLFHVALGDPYMEQAKGLLETSYFLQRDTQIERALLYHQEGYRQFQRDPETAVHSFRQSQRLLDQLGSQVWSARNLLGLARATRNAGDPESARKVAADCVSLAHVLGNPLLQIESGLLLAALTSHWDHAEAEQQLHECISQLRQINHPQLLSLSLTYLAYAQLTNGHFEASVQTCREYQEDYMELGHLRHQSGARMLEAHSRLHLGQYEQSAALLHKVRSVIQASREQLYLNSWLCQISGWLALVRGDLVEARTQLQNGYGNSAYFPGIDVGLVAAIEGKTAEARQLIKQALKAQFELESTAWLAPILAVTACLYAREGDAEQAVALYALAQQDPFVANSRWFADVIGARVQAVAESLSEAEADAARQRCAETDLETAAAALLAQLDSPTETSKASAAPPTQPLFDPLSERELELLQLVAAGKSNREIAAELFLALGTVKSHLHNIYQKLGVRSRTQAIGRAQEFGLL